MIYKRYGTRSSEAASPARSLCIRGRRAAAWAAGALCAVTLLCCGGFAAFAEESLEATTAAITEVTAPAQVSDAAEAAKETSASSLGSSTIISGAAAEKAAAEMQITYETAAVEAETAAAGQEDTEASETQEVSEATEASEATEETSAEKAESLPTAVIWVAGDSTASEFSDNYYYPRYGWGTQLYRYFTNVEIHNLALPGTSTLSYAATDAYQQLLSGMKSGDYLIIGFGHNDEKAESARYTDPTGSVSTPGSTQYCLYENFIKPAKEAGVTPIVCTPIVRRDPGNNYNGASAHITGDQVTIEGTFKGGDYAKAIRNAAVGKGATLIDLTTRTKYLYEQLGYYSRNHQAFASANEASIDNTHTNIYGAAYNAYFIADELLKTSCFLKNYVVDDPTPPDASILQPNPDYSYQPFTRPTEDSSIWPAAGDWKPTVFGDIGALEYLNDIYFTLQPYENGAVRIAAGRLGGSNSEIVGASVGKISAETDGIAMYYQAVPADKDFTLSADVLVNAIDANNQASFGLMARDDIYVDTVTNDKLGDYVAAGPLMAASDSPWNCFARKSGVLTRGATLTRSYGTGDTVHLQITKTSDGYTCTYGENEPVSSGFDFPLIARDPEYVYVGLFAARSVDVTFYNVQLDVQ